MEKQAVGFLGFVVADGWKQKIGESAAGTLFESFLDRGIFLG